MGVLDRLTKPAEALIEAARDLFQNANGQVTPATLAALVPGGREILRSPQPWPETDRKIIRHLDTAYGGRHLWLGGSPSWEDRVEATEFDRAKIAELEANMAAKLETMNLRRMEYVNFERESRRRQALLGRAPYDHDRHRLILPEGEDLSPGAFERLDLELRRAERVYVAALEEYQDAKGALTEYKGRVQEWYFRGELGKSTRAARAEQEARGVRWGGLY